MNFLDKRTLTACIRALDAREKECIRQRLSPDAWAEAKRRCKLMLLQQSADDLKEQTPAFLRRQAD